MASTLSLPPSDDQPQLADMVRILDVAAEMRADREMASRELAVDETKRLLRERLLESAKLTGDGATPEEIDAAIDNYYQSLYTFREPHRSLSVALAQLYVRRGKLGLVTAGVTLLLAVGWLLFNPHSGLLSPTAQLTNKLQAELRDVESLAAKVKKESDDPQTAASIEEQLGQLHAAAEKRDLSGMQAVRPRLIQLEKQASDSKATLRELQSLTAALKKETDDPQATALIGEQLARLGVATEKHDLPTMKDVQ